jgi:SAM-dependent methyltransferase
MTISPLSRTAYQGVLQIFRYNQPFYVTAAASALVAGVLAIHLSMPLRIALLSGAGGAIFWTISSLLASHWVYDRSGLYQLRWLPGCLSQPPMRWLYIHAGIDECSPTIRSLFPGSTGQIVDIYDPSEMTESSIRRARRIAGVLSVPTNTQELPVEDQKFDTAFLIFAAHELRHQEARIQLLREIARVLHARGELVLVEHLRDWVNFLAFGPGFLHFFSAGIWQNAAHTADLSIRLQRTVTPLIHVFVFQRRS